MAVKHKHTSRVNGKKQRSSTYCSWENMKQRCLNPKHPSYHRYGGRGVKVCPQWLTFEGFLKDMGEKPEDGWAISRHKDEGNYEPGNCSWKSKSKNSSEAHRGSKSRLSKVNEDLVLEIRKLYLAGRTQKDISARYSLSQSAVSDIVLGKTWNHVHTQYIKSTNKYNYSSGSPRKGEFASGSKLTTEDVVFIQKLYAQGLPQTEIATRFGVSQSAVSSILTGKTWEHLNFECSKSEPKRNYLTGSPNRGEKAPSAKLSSKSIVEIRELYAQGLTQKQIANKFNVSQSLISSIVLGKIWTHIK